MPHDLKTTTGTIFIPTEDDLTPVDGTAMQQTVARATRAAKEATGANSNVGHLREEFQVALGKVDVSFEKVEKRFDNLEDKVDSTMGHVGDLRAAVAQTSTHVEHILRIVKKDDAIDTKRATTAIEIRADGTKHRRWLSRKLIAFLTAVGTSGAAWFVHHFG